MTNPWERFKQAARLEEPQPVPVGLIVDSPWLPGYAGLDTRDYFLFPEKWLEINLGLLARFPEAVWIPGFWVEYGMAAEPSAFGVRVRFHPDRPPSIEPLVSDLAFWAGVKPADPQEDGLMPLVRRLYEVVDERLHAEGLGIRMVCARGPMTVASWLMGVTPVMMGLISSPGEVSAILDTMTTTIIRWLHAQLDALHQPEGIMLLDDVVGMVSKRHYEEFIHPHLLRIFDEFEGLIRIYHNDTPCPHLLESLAEANFDVFNFSHQMDIGEVKAVMGHRVAVMGNVPPLDVGVRGTPEEVKQWAGERLDKAAPGGGMILSFGGGVSPGTPSENIDALLEAAREWSSRRSLESSKAVSRRFEGGLLTAVCTRRRWPHDAGLSGAGRETSANSERANERVAQV
ncbi:MAG: uroporphyrinogen decarboxylase family protein [Chloroflexi bacterium]|nr:uroporphyrinogen decarboxylase family protein [Chloroflexota bacterium]